MTFRSSFSTTFLSTFKPSFTDIGASFSPLDLEPVLWFDASVASSITETSGAVSQWNDLSGNDHHLKQATTSLQPTTNSRTINGLNSVVFNSDWLRTDTDVAGTSACTTIYVMKTSATASSSEAPYGAEDTFYAERFNFGGTGEHDVLVGGFSNGNTALRNAGNPVPKDTVNIMGSRWSISDNLVETHYAGNITASTTINTAVPRVDEEFVMGILRGLTPDTFLIDTDMCEFIMFNRKLTDEELTAVTEYLEAKWT